MFLGSLLGDTSPVPTYTPLLGAELLLDPGTDARPRRRPDLRARRPRRHRRGLRRRASRPSRTTSPTSRPGRRRSRSTSYDEPVRLLLLGGPPFGEAIVMWWNIVGAHPRGGRRLARRSGRARSSTPAWSTAGSASRSATSCRHPRPAAPQRAASSGAPADGTADRRGRGRALPVGGWRGRDARLPRHRVGPPRPRRGVVPRAADPGGVPVRAVLVDDPQQAPGVPRGLPRLRRRGDRGLRRRRRRAADGTSRGSSATG